MIVLSYADIESSLYQNFAISAGTRLPACQPSCGACGSSARIRAAVRQSDLAVFALFFAQGPAIVLQDALATGETTLRSVKNLYSP